MAEFHKVHIQEIKQETADAVSVVFSIPENLKADFNFTAGQYVTLQKEINGETIRRAYSNFATCWSRANRVSSSNGFSINFFLKCYVLPCCKTKISF